MTSSPSAVDEAETYFWRVAGPLLDGAGVTTSTMMGFPCLRLQGDFFACCDRRSGALVVKLSEAEVDDLLDRGRADPFAPNGRRFRAWATIPYARRRTWSRHLEAALAASAERVGGR